MFKIENDKIHLTRGDTALINITATNDNGTSYTFKADDVVRFNVFKAKDCSTIFLSKDFKVDKESTSVDIELTSDETTIGDLINSPKTYWYEIILNPGIKEQTIVGYDDDGPKELFLYPEAEESDS